MGTVDRYPNGTFCWIELGTPDVSGARAFYAGLFGWDLQGVPTGDGGTYTMCRLDGKDVAAIHEHGPGEGVGWSSYVSVDDVDAATLRSRELGATVLLEPFDVLDAGRMSVVRDPGGAEVSLWQPRAHVGARLVNEIDTWGWNELVTPSMDAALHFYGELFGWESEKAPGPIQRTGFAMGTLLIAGVHVPAPFEAEASRWTVTFRVSDADRAVARVEELGGRILIPPMDIPVGRFALVADPAGAEFVVAAVPGGALRGVDGS